MANELGTLDRDVFERISDHLHRDVEELKARGLSDAQVDEYIQSLFRGWNQMMDRPRKMD